MTATTEPAELFIADTGISSNPETHAHRQPPGIEIIHSHPYDDEHYHPPRATDDTILPGRNPAVWPAKKPSPDDQRYAQRLFGGMVRQRMRAGGHPMP